MKKFFGLFLFLGLVCFSYDVSAQGMYVSSKGKPIMKGDSVLMWLIWNQPSSFSDKMEFEGFYSPDSIDMQNKQIALYIYPKATRKFIPQSLQKNGKIMKYDVVPTAVKMFTIVVLDENGNEVRDEFSDVVNTPVDFRKLDVTGKTIEEIRAEYDITHKEIPAKKETAENSAAEQKSQNAK